MKRQNKPKKKENFLEPKARKIASLKVWGSGFSPKPSFSLKSNGTGSGHGANDNKDPPNFPDNQNKRK